MKKLIEVTRFTVNGVDYATYKYDLDGKEETTSVEEWGGETEVVTKENEATEAVTQTYSGVKKLGFVIEVDSIAEWQALPTELKNKIPNYSLARLLTTPVRYFAKLSGSWVEVDITPV